MDYGVYLEIGGTLFGLIVVSPTVSAIAEIQLILKVIGIEFAIQQIKLFKPI